MQRRDNRGEEYEARSRNLIIHGAEEADDENDKTFITCLKEAVGANEVQHKSISRIGQVNLWLSYATDKKKKTDQSCSHK